VVDAIVAEHGRIDLLVANAGVMPLPPTSAVYSGTKFAAWAITEGLRIESPAGIPVTTICPGVTESELADSISDPVAREAMIAHRTDAIPASSIAEAVSYAVGQPADVDVNEIIVRPAARG
jgi:NADP-dependent 3-hydroxy acid dehydrogenase YdfG